MYQEAWAVSPLSFAIKLLKEKKWEGGKVRGGGGPSSSFWNDISKAWFAMSFVRIILLVQWLYFSMNYLFSLKNDTVSLGQIIYKCM